MDCIFCKIANKEIPSYTIYEDKLVIAFLDINPDSNGHTLIVPKKHYQDLADIDIEVLEHTFYVAKLLKEKLEKKLNITGLTLIQNNGDIQDVKHFHLHLKPHYQKNKVISIEEIYEIIKKDE